MFQFIDQEAMMPASTEHHGMDIGMFIQVFPLMIPVLFILFGFFVTLSFSSLGSKGIIEAFQKASGAARKTSSRLPGSSFKEKTQAASAAVKSAFSPGTSVAPAKTGDSDDAQKKSSFAMAREGSMRRRQQTGVGTAPSDTRRPITEVASHAGKGTVSATESIATEFSETVGQESDKIASLRTPSSSPDSKNVPGKKCPSFGASMGAGTSLCPLCRKNAFASKE